MRVDKYHLHCINGCEKAAGEYIEGELVCCNCGGPFLPCNPEICPEHNEEIIQRFGYNHMLIFLDIDGVLNRLGEAYNKYGWVHSRDHTNWHKDLLVNLERVCVTTGADVVISSSWRILHGTDANWWNEQFKLAGVKINVIDITGLSNNGFRGREVNTWLTYNNYSNYVIIDDESDFFPDQPRIKCNHEHGLTEAKAQEAIDILTGHKNGLGLWCMTEANPPG